MTFFKKIKNNLFIVVLVLTYATLFIINPKMGVNSIKSSGYFIKEMLIIMPIIFVLTALLDLWVPKEKIVSFLGVESGAKGIILSFVVGSISAGPIYAAFPMCLMLHKKGASIRNIVIILSSWAVIKIPMLVNEAKFLGPKFMGIRWVLTIISIIIFSWIAGRIIKDEDLPNKFKSSSGLNVNKDACIGCGLCAKDYPEAFKMEGRKAIVKEDGNLNKESIVKAVETCPVNAITYEEKSTDE
ncbi:MAG: permease [Lagierella massiliensis]|nr:permease [Lagierella massiliensis]